MAATAQDRGWGECGVHARGLTRVKCAGIPLRVRSEVAPLFEVLVGWLTWQRTQTKVPPLSSSGGYNKRFISNTTVWSNHAWGLAVDFNAGTNPYAFNARMDMPPGTSAFASKLGMRWGGDYRGKRDGMHFEFMGTPADAARLVKTLNARQQPKEKHLRLDELHPKELDDVTVILCDGKNNYVTNYLVKRRIKTVEEDKALRKTGLPVFEVPDSVTANIPDA